MLADGLPIAGCEADVCGSGGRVVGVVVGGATGGAAVVGGDVGGGEGRSIVVGVTTCLGGSVVDDDTVVEGAGLGGVVVRTG
jgi:hypothetical protein